jgi:hypothetical protein
MLDLQSWIALPIAHEEIAPSFRDFSAEALPVVEDGGLRARIVAGSAFGKSAPVGMLSEWLYVEVALESGAAAPLDPDYQERAIYVVEGEIEIYADLFEGPRLLVFRPGDRITLTARRPSRVTFLGGAAMEGARHIWWHFVSSSTDGTSQRGLEGRLLRPSFPQET